MLQGQNESVLRVENSTCSSLFNHSFLREYIRFLFLIGLIYFFTPYLCLPQPCLPSFHSEAFLK